MWIPLKQHPIKPIICAGIWERTYERVKRIEQLSKIECRHPASSSAEIANQKHQVGDTNRAENSGICDLRDDAMQSRKHWSIFHSIEIQSTRSARDVECRYETSIKSVQRSFRIIRRGTDIYG